MEVVRRCCECAEEFVPLTEKQIRCKWCQVASDV